MKRRFRRVAVFTSTAALGAAVISGCGSDSSTTSTAAASTPQQQQGARARGGFDTTALAAELGVSKAKLDAAMQAVRPTGATGGTPPTGTTGGTPPTGGAPGGGQSDMAAKLAKQLGLSTAKVQAALKSTGGFGGPPAA